MSGPNNDSQYFTPNSTDEGKKITCHIVSLPKIILTRIDEGGLPVPKHRNPLLKKGVKRLTEKKNKTVLPKIKPTKSSKVTVNKNELRVRGRPKKIDPNFITNFSKSYKNVTNSKVPNAKEALVAKKSAKEIVKSENNSVKGMLKKTMLQKRSKIVIPPAKKPKLSATKQSKLTPPKPKKPSPQKIKVEVAQTKLVKNDSSEDEFLYDELIEELENSPLKQVASVKPIVEKTVNITLKRNVGNKPPTIVKGGIVKKSDLTADLKSIANPNNLNSSKHGKSAQNLEEKGATSGILNEPVFPDNLDPEPAKKASPWPVTISSPSKTNLKEIKNKTKKKSFPKVAKAASSTNAANMLKGPKKHSIVTPQEITAISSNDIKPVHFEKDKPKIGPKKTAKVTPLSKSVVEENVSDEYTEEETLENIDSEPIGLLSKLINDTSESDTVETEIKHANINIKLDNVGHMSTTDSKDDEDPNLDLLRILTDDSDDIIPLHSSKPLENGLETKMGNDKSSTRGNISPSESSNHTSVDSSSHPSNDHSTGDSDGEPLPDYTVTNVSKQEAPKVETHIRTIYDLMNDVSLQHPSWNLHIIPETNAFCIAQVTRGRLGLPTLKKCIELDPEDYHAKVYIHQYHIKRFDGVYDSEESILALIEEINSIKA